MGKLRDKIKITRKEDMELENDGAFALYQNSGTPQTLNLSTKSVIIACSIVLILVIIAAALAYTLPTGQYDTIVDSHGNVEIDPNGEFHFEELPRLAWWKLLLSPIMILDSLRGI